MGINADSFMVFSVSGCALAFPVGDVRHVYPIAWMEKPVAAPDLVMGMVDLGDGRLMTVIRLDQLLGLPAQPVALTDQILLMRGRANLGLLVNRVHSVADYPPDALSPADPARTFQGAVSANLRTGQGGVAVLSWSKLLLREEEERLTRFHDHLVRRRQALGDRAGWDDAL